MSEDYHTELEQPAHFLYFKLKHILFIKQDKTNLGIKQYFFGTNINFIHIK